jgi:hypothetical protein
MQDNALGRPAAADGDRLTAAQVPPATACAAATAACRCSTRRGTSPSSAAASSRPRHTHHRPHQPGKTAPRPAGMVPGPRDVTSHDRRQHS